MSLVNEYLKHKAARKRNEVTIFQGSVISGGVHENGFPEAIVAAAERAEREGLDPFQIEVPHQSLDKVESQTIAVPALIEACRQDGFEVQVNVPKVMQHLIDQK